MNPETPANRGILKNGNPPGDFAKAPRCGAKTRQGSPCRAPAMLNGRCRMHGGTSTGPTSAEGLERCRQARWIHGGYSRGAREEQRRFREVVEAATAAIDQLRMQKGEEKKG